eukprot:COSAG04_NODE_8833_length_926_cov_1.308343_1_plen_101_part_10
MFGSYFAFDHVHTPQFGAPPDGSEPSPRGPFGDALLQVIPPIGAEGLNRRPPAGSCRLFLGPGFRLGARWNRLGEAVKTRKKREKTGKKWARYGLRVISVK